MRNPFIICKYYISIIDISIIKNEKNIQTTHRYVPLYLRKPEVL